MPQSDSTRARPAYRAGRPITVLWLAIALVIASCGSGSSEEASATTAAPSAEAEATPNAAATDEADENPDSIERSELSAAENFVLDEIVEAVVDRPEAWSGFNLEEIPTIVPLIDESGMMTSAFAFFHSNPEAAGDAVPVNGIDGLPDLHYIPQIVDVPQPERFSFDFDTNVGGVQTYVFPAETELQQWFSNVFVHEAFHAFQIQTWEEPDNLDQQAYDLELRNYELAVIEDRALIAAYESNGDERTEAIRHFLALRETRLMEFPTTTLDGQQEVLEGTAEWFEWRTTERSEVDAPFANPFSANIADPAEFAALWAGDFAGVAPLQRWYHTGATQLELLDQLGVDWQPRLEQQTWPATLLAEAVEVDPSEIDSLVEAAVAAYNPLGDAAGFAEAWLTAAPSQDAPPPEEVGSFADAPSSVIECVAGYGLTAEQIDADPSLLTDEINADCVEGFQARAFQCMADAGIDLDTADFENLPPEAIVCFE